MKKWYLVVIMITVMIFMTSCGVAEEEGTGDNDSESKGELLIGVIPAQTEGEMQAGMEKLQETLSEELDRNVNVETYPDYNGVVEAMNYEKIDMAYFGPLTYVIAHEKSGAKAIITQLVDGEPFYHSYIITHKDSKWNSLDELLQDSKEVNFAFGDQNSTSGSLIPSIELKDRGVFESQNEHEFASVTYTGSHDATSLAVENKQNEAGAVDSAIYNQLVEAGKVKGDQLKVIWESDKLFQYPWAVKKSMDDETVKALQDVFLKIDDEKILNAFGASGFIKASNEDYESIREAAVKQGVIEE
jgi:phosphonate transport system substrate-binding protein